MAKFTLNSILSGFQSISLFNSNNDKIEDHLNNKILYRDNPLGEPNQMENNLDMNSNRILNLPVPVNDTEPARLVDLTNITSIDVDVITSVGTDNFTNESSIPGATLTEVLNNVNGALESINSTLTNVANWVSDDFVRKTGDTSRSNDATLSEDPHLVVSGLSSGQTYMVSGVLYKTEPTASSSNFKWKLSAGSASGPTSTENSSLVSSIYGSTVSSGHTVTSINAADPASMSGATSAFPPNDTVTKVLLYGMIQVPIGEDRIALYWSQIGASANETILHEDSFILLTKVAVPGAGIWDAPTNELVYPVADPITGGGAIITDSTTSRTLALTDTSSYIRFTNSSAITVTAPPNTSEDFVIGAEVHLRQAGTGTVTVAEGSGVTVTPPFEGTLALAGQGATATLKKVAANTWELFGQVAGA